jgi:tetratricopeptide (TPR) repeat protein/transcriptional regulator with XRE-family HTH domain
MGMMMPELAASTFGQLLRRLRKNAGLTQKELACAAGVSERAVSDLERGINQTARAETARRLATALRLEGPENVIFVAVAQDPPSQDGAALPEHSELLSRPRTLPRDIASFTGREPELRELLEVATRAGGTVAINAIDGMAGIGKTALVVHAAHQLAGSYPDGQIFLPLHGHTPGQRPVEPTDALASLLLATGVSARQIGEGLQARIALWRSRVAGRHMLLVLDDAVDSEQVRPLLPGTAGSLVLITSRRRLTALDDAHVIRLGALPPDRAAALLGRLAGRPGLDSSDPAVAQITALCGCLPLAIGMLGRQLRHRPAWAPTQAAAYLAAARNRLDAMKTENLSVAAAFELSYRDLSPDQQRLFRRLGIHPGTGIDAYAAAALDGTDLDTARVLLEGLYDQNLLTEPGPGRYGMHDLIRRYAQDLAAADPDADRHRALDRLMNYYQHTAARADARMARRTRPGLPPAAPAKPPAGPDLDDEGRAQAWARAERANLLACLDHATVTGQHARIIALTSAVTQLLLLDGPWIDAATRHATASQAAQHLGDRLAEANALTDFGEVADDFPRAALTLEQALSIYLDLGDRRGQANALHILGTVRRLTSDYRTAARTLEQALSVYRDLGDQLGQGNALSALGIVRWQAGDYPAAAQALKQALTIYRDQGNRRGQANALRSLGNVLLLTGDYPAATQNLEQAGSIYRGLGLGYRGGAASVLTDLGTVRRLTGDCPAAARDLEQGLSMYRELGDQIGEANALHELGIVRRLMGDYLVAAQNQEQALSICRDLGYRGGEADVLNETGTLHRIGSAPARAKECHQQALELARAVCSSWGEAHALAGLGRCARDAGRAAQAETLLRNALEIFQRIGAADASELLAEIDALAGPYPLEVSHAHRESEPSQPAT